MYRYGVRKKKLLEVICHSDEVQIHFDSIDFIFSSHSLLIRVQSGGSLSLIDEGSHILLSRFPVLDEKRMTLFSHFLSYYQQFS